LADVNQLTHLLEAAALLAGERGRVEVSEAAGQIMAMLGYGQGDGAEAARQARLLKVAAKLGRLFQLQAPDAPGLVFFGGVADPALIGWRGCGHGPISLAGAGLSIREAFESCAGEGAEYLSQFDTAQDAVENATIDQRAAALHPALLTLITTVMRHVALPPDRRLAWIGARRLSDGAATAVPADLCLRRSADAREFLAPFKLSTGCGAGATFEDAVLHGLCELIERDALALWWRGGRRGRAVAAESAAGRVASDLLVTLRGGQTHRATWLLDITTDLGVPCLAAISTDPDGYGLASGFASRPTVTAAARAAIIEMCQMELGRAVVEAKRSERGEAALNEADRAYLRRGTIDTARCSLLHPVAPPVEHEETHTLDTIVCRLHAMGIEPLVVDLTRPIVAIPVARVIAPGLQVEPSPIVTERLARTIEETGGAMSYTVGIALV
jgi:ribosomal protein S12 methylthiotransferase accessory factor